MATALRIIVWVVLTLCAAHSRATEAIPPQTPLLMIEPGMHAANVQRVGVSADGRLLATGSDDKTIRLWSLPDGKPIRTFRIPAGPVNAGKIFAMALSPDGRTVAAAGWDAWYDATGEGHFIYVIDTVTGSMLARLGPLPDTPQTLRFSPDGHLLAVGISSGGIRIWRDLTPVFEDRDYAGSVYGIAFSADGRLATASYDSKVRLYDARFRQLWYTTPRDDTRPFSLEFSPDGSRIAVGFESSALVEVLDGHDLAFLFSPELPAVPNGNLSQVAWSADGATLAAAGSYFAPDFIRQMLQWPEGGRGKMASTGIANDTVLDITQLPKGGFVYGAAGPAIGIVDRAGARTLFLDTVTADMRAKTGDSFWVARDASAAWFGLWSAAQVPYLFDVKTLKLEEMPQPPLDFVRPVINSLAVEDWVDSRQPVIDAQVLPMENLEMARSLAIPRDRKSFVLGADWHLYRFDARGTQIWSRNSGAVVWGVNLSGDGEIIVAALGDGTLRWYRTADGVELLSFFVNRDDKRWIAWTPRGYYAASPGGEDLVGWLVNGKTFDDMPDFFPASNFRDTFYRPDIVQRVLSLRDEARAIEVANIISGNREKVESIQKLLPPVIEIAEETPEIVTDTRNIDLKYRLRSPSGRDITRIEIQIDGRPVTPRAAIAVDEQEASHVLSVSVPPRDAEVTLIAYIGDQPSVPVTMPVKWRGQKEASKKPRLFALMVGVSDYAETSLKLNYAAKDASDLAAMLQAQEGVFYDQVEVTLLLNAEADEDSIQQELSRLRKKATPEDNVIVFMAGHGVTDEAQDFYFLPTGANLAPDMLTSTAIDGDIIRKGLSKIPGKVILFMDACYSGSGIGAGGTSRVDMSGLSNGMTDGASVVMFASSTGREVSYEDKAWENGAFTEALMATLSDNAAYGADGKLSISELDENLTTRVEELTEGKQTPVMTKPGAIKRFFLAAL